MELSKETRDRIFTAAETLYDQAGRSAFPTVDMVRRLAKANMNDASIGMKEWRRAQTTQTTPITVQVPEAVQQASNTALTTLWQQAQELANESLLAAQAKWETERSEAEILNKQIADAYETQTTDLDTARAEARAKIEALEQAKATADNKVVELHGQLAAITERAIIAETRVQEIEHHASVLDASCNRAYKDADQARADLAKIQVKAEVDQEAYRQQRKLDATGLHRITERLAVVEAERDQAVKAAAQAREEIAGLIGQLSVFKGQGKQSASSIKIKSARKTNE